MNEEIFIAILSFIGTLAGTFGGIYATSRLSNYRIQQLEKKVDMHNNLIQRVYLIEQNEAVFENRLKTCDHRISDLENEQKAERRI